MPLWHKDYFELKALEKQQMQEKLSTLPLSALTPVAHQKVTSPEESIRGWKKRIHLLWMGIQQGSNANSTSDTIYRRAT